MSVLEQGVGPATANCAPDISIKAQASNIGFTDNPVGFFMGIGLVNGKLMQFFYLFSNPLANLLNKGSESWLSVRREKFHIYLILIVFFIV
jgi:hypothetical protein